MGIIGFTGLSFNKAVVDHPTHVLLYICLQVREHRFCLGAVDVIDDIPF